MAGRGRHLEPPLVRLPGPAARPARPSNLLGGTQIGNTGIWIGDYTIQPENGGLSVFFHEYGHDLGLPDDYNTSAGGDNNNEHWTLMAQSRLGAKGEQCIGDRAGDLGAWNKLQLGWLDYETVVAPGQQQDDLKLGPQEYNTDKAAGRGRRAARRRRSSPSSARRPPGAKQWCSGDGDDLDNTHDPDGRPAGRTRRR